MKRIFEIFNVRNSQQGNLIGRRKISLRVEKSTLPRSLTSFFFFNKPLRTISVRHDDFLFWIVEPFSMKVSSNFLFLRFSKLKTEEKIFSSLSAETTNETMIFVILFFSAKRSDLLEKSCQRFRQLFHYRRTVDSRINSSVNHFPSWCFSGRTSSKSRRFIERVVFFDFMAFFHSQLNTFLVQQKNSSTSKKTFFSRFYFNESNKERHRKRFIQFHFQPSFCSTLDSFGFRENIFLHKISQKLRPFLVLLQIVRAERSFSFTKIRLIYFQKTNKQKKKRFIDLRNPRENIDSLTWAFLFSDKYKRCVACWIVRHSFSFFFLLDSFPSSCRPRKINEKKKERNALWFSMSNNDPYWRKIERYFPWGSIESALKENVWKTFVIFSLNFVSCWFVG